MKSIFVQAFLRIPKLYLYTLPLTALSILVSFTEEASSMTHFFIGLGFFILIAIFGEYYKTCLIVQSNKKTIKLDKYFKNLIPTLKKWLITSIKNIWQIAKWLIPAYFALLIAYAILFSRNWSLFINDPSGQLISPSIDWGDLNMTVIILAIVFGLAFIYMLYRSIRRMLGLFFASVIAIDSKKSPNECLAHSEKITDKNYLFLIKTLFIATVFSMLIFNLLYFVNLENLELMSFSQKVLNIDTYIAILIINLTTTYSLNITGLAYKKLK